MASRTRYHPPLAPGGLSTANGIRCGIPAAPSGATARAASWFSQNRQSGIGSHGPHPSAGRPRAVEPPADAVVAAVLAHRVVDREHDQLRRPVAVQVGDRDAASLVLPEPPVRHRDPRPPPGHDPVGAERTAAVVAGVRARRSVHHEHDEVQLTVAVDVRHRDVGAGVQPREPVRDRRPRSPATGHRAVGVERPADPVVPAVRPVGGVHHEHDQVEPAVPVDVGDRDPRTLVLEGEPVGHLPPRAPRGDRPLPVARAPDAVCRGVLPGRVVDGQDDDVRVAVAAQVDDRDAGSRRSPRRSSPGRR